MVPQVPEVLGVQALPSAAAAEQADRGGGRMVEGGAVEDRAQHRFHLVTDRRRIDAHAGPGQAALIGAQAAFGASDGPVSVSATEVGRRTVI